MLLLTHLDIKCVDAPAFADARECAHKHLKKDSNANLSTHRDAGACTHVRGDHKCCSVRRCRNERGHLMKGCRIIDDISVLEPPPP